MFDEYFTRLAASRAADSQARPGSPIYPSISIEQAKRAEQDRNLADPLGTAAWDLAADARQLAWDESCFAPALDYLTRMKHNGPYEPDTH